MLGIRGQPSKTSQCAFLCTSSFIDYDYRVAPVTTSMQSAPPVSLNSNVSICWTAKSPITISLIVIRSMNRFIPQCVHNHYGCSKQHQEQVLRHWSGPFRECVSSLFHSFSFLRSFLFWEFCSNFVRIGYQTCDLVNKVYQHPRGHSNPTSDQVHQSSSPCTGLANESSRCLEESISRNWSGTKWSQSFKGPRSIYWIQYPTFQSSQWLEVRALCKLLWYSQSPTVQWSIFSTPIYFQEDLSVESDPKTVLQNRLRRSRGKLQELGPVINNKRTYFSSPD